MELKSTTTSSRTTVAGHFKVRQYKIHHLESQLPEQQSQSINLFYFSPDAKV